MTLTLVVKSVIKAGDNVVTPISSSDAITEVCACGEAKLVRSLFGIPLMPFVPKMGGYLESEDILPLFHCFVIYEFTRNYFSRI